EPFDRSSASAPAPGPVGAAARAVSIRRSVDGLEPRPSRRRGASRRADPSKRCSPGSTLRELEPLARPRATRLLPLHLPRVARQQAALAQRAPQLRIEAEQRAGDAQADRAGLPALAAALDVHLDVEATLQLRHDQRLLR